MRTKMGSNYGNFIVAYKEVNFQPVWRSQLYAFYINDCNGATSSSKEELNQFINFVNIFRRL